MRLVDYAGTFLNKWTQNNTRISITCTVNVPDANDATPPGPY